MVLLCARYHVHNNASKNEELNSTMRYMPLAGLGTAEECFRAIYSYYKIQMQESVNQAASSGSCVERGVPMVVCQRATDIDSTCRYTLMQHGEALRPQCLFGDILDRVPEHAKEQLEKLRRTYVEAAEHESQACSSANTGGMGNRKRKADAALHDFREELLESGRGFITEAVDLLSRCMEDKNKIRGHCYVHGKRCTANTQKIPSFRGFCVNITGFSCLDWSCMGAQKGWLGSSSIPWAQWCAERLHAANMNTEDFVIAECTRTFDAAHFETLVSPKFHFAVLHVTPELLGEPVCRNRIYMILLAKNKRAWVPEVLQRSVQEVFEQTFGSSVIMHVMEKFRAPAHDVAAFVEAAGKKQRMPNASASGRKWSYLQVASASMRASIKEHTDYLEQHIEHFEQEEDEDSLNGPRFARWVCNLAQRPGYMPPTKDRVPALLRRSILYLFGQQRQAIPNEDKAQFRLAQL